MKEIDLGGATLLEYDNEKIYSNYHKIANCCLISLVIAFMTAVAYISMRTFRDSWSLDFMFYAMFFVYLLLPPLTLFLQYRKSEIRPSAYSIDELENMRRRIKPIENKITRFPFASTVCRFLMFEIMKFIMLFIVGLFDVSNYWGYVGIWANHIGQMLLSSIFIYIALIFLVKNCKLMRKEWEANPPRLVQTAIKEKQDEQNKIIEQRNYEQYKSLIEKCGMKFFIKYYKQIKRLPLRDVEVTENYSPVEREERLQAAKQIIDSNLTEFTLEEIIKSYSDILDNAELAQAKQILSELQSCNNQPAKQVKVQPKQHDTTAATPPYCDDWDDKDNKRSQ